MEINQMSGAIVDCAYHIHAEVGPGLLEHVYEVVLADALRQKGLSVERQVPIPIKIGDRIFTEGFCADIIVEKQIIIEIKSVRAIEVVFKKQLLTYLKLSGLKLGLLINFGGALLKGNIERLVVGEIPDFRS